MLWQAVREGGGSWKRKGTLSCSVTVQNNAAAVSIRDGGMAREGAELRGVGRILLCPRRVRAPAAPLSQGVLASDWGMDLISSDLISGRTK